MIQGDLMFGNKKSFGEGTNSATSTTLVTPVNAPGRDLLFGQLAMVRNQFGSSFRELEATLEQVQISLENSQRDRQRLEAELEAVRAENRSLKLANEQLRAANADEPLNTSMNMPTMTASLFLKIEDFANRNNSLDAIIAHLRRSDVTELPMEPGTNKSAIHGLCKRTCQPDDVKKLKEIIGLMLAKYNVISIDDLVSQGGYTPLLYAVHAQLYGLNLSVLQAILAFNPSLTHCNQEGNNALTFACTERAPTMGPSSSIIKALIEATDDVAVIKYKNNLHKDARELLTILKDKYPERYKLALDLLEKKFFHQENKHSGKRPRTLSPPPAAPAVNEDDDNDNGVSISPRN